MGHVIQGKLKSFRPLVIHIWLRLNDPLFLWSESSVLMSTLVMTMANSSLTLAETCPTHLALVFVGLKNKLAKIQEEIHRKKSDLRRCLEFGDNIPSL